MLSKFKREEFITNTIKLIQINIVNKSQPAILTTLIWFEFEFIRNISYSQSI